MSFGTLGLCDALLKSVAEQGYTTPSPIQIEAIPAVLKQRDLMAVAQTGTGKTAALPCHCCNFYPREQVHRKNLYVA